jgi:acyl-coenzyme A thioesterase PaaI-like protein
MLCFSSVFSATKCLLFVGLQNVYRSVHGGAVAAIAETVSIACARTVVAEDKELFLGELNMSYLSGARSNVSFFFFFSP